jgi:hypothetical protein
MNNGYKAGGLLLMLGVLICGIGFAYYFLYAKRKMEEKFKADVAYYEDMKAKSAAFIASNILAEQQGQAQVTAIGKARLAFQEKGTTDNVRGKCAAAYKHCSAGIVECNTKKNTCLSTAKWYDDVVDVEMIYNNLTPIPDAEIDTVLATIYAVPINYAEVAMVKK